jgi:hypothetical protein
VPDSFAALFVLFVVFAVGMTAYRVSSARRRARDIGMDPDAATRAVLFNQQPGLALKALELEHRLARREAQEPAAAPESDESASVGARLEELQRLYRRGLINEDEFAEKRAAILKSL